jgi:CHAT domain-containing protein
MGRSLKQILSVVASVLLLDASDALGNTGQLNLEMAKKLMANDDLPAALRLAEKAAAEFAREDKSYEESYARLMAGGICEQLASYECALRHFNGAASAVEAAGYPAMAVMPRLLAFQIMGKSGNLLEALNGITRFEQAVERMPLDAGAKRTFRGKIHQLMGMINSELGNYDAALALLDQSEQELAGDKVDSAQSLVAAGKAATALAWHEEAQRRFRSASLLLDEIEKSGNVRPSARLPLGTVKIDLLTGLAVLHLQAGEYDQARASTSSAKEIAIASGRRAMEVSARTFHAITLFRGGRFSDLKTELDAIDKLAAQVGDLSTSMLSDVLRATLISRESPSEARSVARRALKTATQIQSSQGVAWSLVALGAAQRELGETDLAVASFKQAVSIIEETKNRMLSADAALALAGRPKHIYESLIQLLVLNGHVPDALTYLERYRASLFLRLAPKSKDGRWTDEYGALAAAELAARQRLMNLERLQERASAGRPSAQDLAQLQAAKMEYRQAAHTLRTKAPSLAAQRSVVWLSAEELQEYVLSDDDVLLEYYVFEEMLLAWVVDKTHVWARLIPIKRPALEKLVTSFRHGIAERAPGAKQAEELHDLLVAPVQQVMKGRRLIVVPHGILHQLPFAALRDRSSGRFLSQDFLLSTAPSATSLLFAHRNRSENRWRALVFGDPDGSLPNARNEALDVAKQLNSHARIEAEASESEIRRVGGTMDIIHLAAHGAHRKQSPMFSSINLAKGGSHDGALHVHEIFSLDLREANLVVLSACESGIGHLTEGEELIGFVAALLHSGASSIISTLWRVDDRASALLMIAFYSEWRGGASMAEALTRAQQHVRSRDGGRWSHPYYWSGFTLTGLTN